MSRHKRKRLGNYNNLRPLKERRGEGYLKRRAKKIARRIDRKKRLPDGN